MNKQNSVRENYYLEAIIKSAESYIFIGENNKALNDIAKGNA